MLRHYGKSSLKWGPISVLKYYVKVKSLQVTKTLPCKHFKKSGAWILSKSSPGIIERCKHIYVVSVKENWKMQKKGWNFSFNTDRITVADIY